MAPSDRCRAGDQMKIFYLDHFVVPLPSGHRFPMQKYALLRERVMAARLVPEREFRVPHAASDEDLERAHSADYVRRVTAGRLSEREIRAIGFPWSPALVHRSRRSVGGTIAACRSACTDGIAVSLAGGTHHAFSDRGQSFCIFNDSAVAAHAMLAEHRAERIMIIDCDVHQGDGTAAIFANEPKVFTFSIHGSRNFPVNKQQSDLDVGLADGTGDQAYLAALDSGMTHAFTRMLPSLVIYLAGADPYEDDRYGRLALSKAGLARRDALVLDRCRKVGAAVAVTMAGGYARRLDDVVDIHFQTVYEAARRSKR